MLIDVENLTLNAREVESVSDVIFERVFNESDLSEYHDIETGIDVTTQIVLAGRIGLLGKKTTGCTPNEANGLEFREKFWEPVMEDFRLSHCATDVPTLLKIFRKAQKVNPDFFDRVGSEEFGVIISNVESAMTENIHRKVWFNDKAAAVSTGGGVFTPGTDLGYFNSFDGLFKQIMVDAQAGETPRVTIDANAGANYAAQKLPANKAIEILQAMVEAADERLISDESAYFAVTRGIAENYRATLRTSNLGAGFMEVVENGRPKLFFDGIEVKVRYDWGRYIKAYQNNGTKYNLPNRAILTVKSNIPVGTLSEEDLAKLDVFYDRTLKKNFMDAAYTIDAKHLEGYLTVAAY